MLYRFGELELEPARYHLLRSGVEVPIAPRALDLLIFLVENRDRVVTRETLLAEVWGGQYVDEGALTQAVHSLRAALGEDPQAPRFIVTVRGRGYRFAAPVRVEAPAGQAPERPISASAASESPVSGSTRSPTRPAGRLSVRLRRGIAALAMGIVLGGLIFLVARPRPVEAGAVEGSIALTPIVNASGDESLSWVELGLADLIARSLETTDGVSLVPLTEVVSVLERLDDPGTPEAALRVEALTRATGAQAVVSTVLSEEDGLYKIRATLIAPQARPRSHTVSGSDLFALADALAERVHTWVAGPDSERIEVHGTGYPEQPELRELFAAGMQLQLEGNPRGALRFFELVLEEAPTLHGVSYEKAIALRKLGEVERSATLADTLLDEVRAAGLLPLEGKVRNLLGILDWMRGDLEAARRHLERALEIHRRLGDQRGQAVNLTNLGILASGRGQWALAARRYEEALALAEEIGSPTLRATVYNSLGVLAWSRGDIERSGRMHQRALELRRQTGDRHGEAASLNNLGTVAHARGRFGEAEELHGQSLALRRELGNRPGVVSSLANIAAIAADRGRFRQAKALYSEALELEEELGLDMERARILGNLARMAAAREEWTRARELSAEALALNRERGRRAGVVVELSRQTELAVERGAIEEAVALLEAMEAEAEGLDSALPQAILESSRARVAVARGRRQEAIAHLAGAAELAREARNPALESDIAVRLSEQLLEQGAVAEARRRLATLEGGWEEWWRLHWVRSRLAFSEGDVPRAFEAATHARALAGEHWGNEQEAFLVSLRHKIEAATRDQLAAEPLSAI